MVKVVERGYHGATARDLAQRLGRTVPAIYYHYENNQALLVALLAESIDDLVWRAGLVDAENSGDPVRRLAALVEYVTLYAARRRKLTFLDAEICSLEPCSRIACVAGNTLGASDARSAARAILRMCRGVASWYAPEGPMTSEELALTYVSYALGLVKAL